MTHLIDNFERFLRQYTEVPLVDLKGSILLASYPKSGNTWFRFVSSNVLSLCAQSEPVTFHSIRNFSPEIRGNRKLNGVVTTDKAPTFLKTHFYNVPGFKHYNALVLFRDPVKTFQSYFNYMQLEHGKNYNNIKSFIASPRVGLSAWKLFHSSWLNHKKACFISYDELIKKQHEGLNCIYNYYGYEIPSAILDEAILNSSRENMSKIESDLGDPSKVNKGYKFVGQKDGRHGEIENEIRDIIVNSSSEVYEQLMNRRLLF